MEPKVISENDNYFVLDKPAGWIVNSAATTGSQPVVQKWLDTNFDYPLSGDNETRSGIVHRLDKETSGILLVAKTKNTFDYLQLQFKERKIKKTYITLLHGNVKPVTGEIKTTVGRLPWRRDRFGILPGGRESLSRYMVINYYELPDAKKPHLKSYTLTEFYPQTGRTHQIRIHAKFIGHPIAGDDFYAGRKTARDDRKWCPRLFLHALKITFFEPDEKKSVTYGSQLPDDLIDILKKLNKT